MRIVRVTINNFRTIKSLTFHSSQHNVLIGPLNVGKSTLLNAIALVLDPDVGRRYQAVDEMDFYARNLIDADDRPVPINIEITVAHCSASDRNDFLEYWEPWNSETKELLEDADNIKILDDKRYEFAFRMAFRAAYDRDEGGISYFWYYPKFSFLEGSAERRVCPRKDREKVGFFLIPAERNVRKALSFSRYSALDKALRADDVSLEKQVADVVAQVKGKGNLLFDNKGFSNLIQEMEKQVEVLLRLRPGIERRILFELSDLGHYGIMNALRAFVALDGQDEAYPISSQGMGAKQVIVLAALRMLSKRRASSILAIEEPETGLHPHMQRSLVDDLLRSASQTFITTHSVHVAQTVGQDHIFCLLDAGNGARRIVPVIPSSEYGYDAKTIRKVTQLCGHHPTDVLDALFAPSVLLTEGVGDREAVPTLLRRLCHVAGSTNRDLDGLGIAIIPCQSKQSIPKIAPYFKTQLGKRVYALVDSEPSTVGDNPKVVAACDYTFIWPERCSIEKVLLLGAKDKSIDAFIHYITNDLGDDYFTNAGSATHDACGKRTDVFRYLKGEKARHRLFAERLPVNEISLPVRQLLDHLNSVSKGEYIGEEVHLDT